MYKGFKYKNSNRLFLYQNKQQEAREYQKFWRWKDNEKDNKCIAAFKFSFSFKCFLFKCYLRDEKKQPPEEFYKKGVLKNFAIFTGKHLCWGLFLIKLQTWPAFSLKRRLQRRCFPVSIAKFLRTPVLKNICERLILNGAKK